MFGRSSLVQIPFVIAAILIGGYFARYAFTQGTQTVIASELPRTNVQPGPLQPLSGCGLDAKLRYDNPLRCEMEMRQAAAEARGANPLVFHAPKPPATMTRAESETASGWFMLAMAAIPLSLGAAALLAFLILRAATASRDQ